MTMEDRCRARTFTRAEEGELGAAARLQRALLPPSPQTRGAWSAAHRFSPAGDVGGDIIDLIPCGDDMYFLLADVSGKGVAASLLTAYLHAVFRSLVPFGLPIEEVVRRASALLCASTLSAQYATLIFGVLHADGEVVLANAGHPAAFVVGAAHEISVVATGAAAGLFCDSEFGTARFTLAPGATLLLYSDGVTDAFDSQDREYGQQRLQAAAAAAAQHDPVTMLSRIAEDHARFLDVAVAGDDWTMLAIRRLDASLDEFTVPMRGCHDTAL